MNWGKSIVLVFIIFAGIIITMVTISMRQEVNLVEKNYYEEEIAYQDQIDRIENFEKLEEKPSIKHAGGILTISFPSLLYSSVDNGSIQLYRPSTSTKDKKYKIALDQSGVQNIPISSLEKGLWKIKLRWVSADKEYFTSQSIVI